VEGNINLLAAIRDAGVRRYLLQSSGFWYAAGAGLADESVRSSPVRPRESRPAPAPTWNWKRAHRRRRESSSGRAPLRILLRPRHLVHARGRYGRPGTATAGSDYR
jgi:hypothetical protein